MEPRPMTPTPVDLARARAVTEQLKIHVRHDSIANVNWLLVTDAIAMALQAERREFWDAIAEGLRCSGSTLDVTTIQHAHELPRLIQQAQRNKYAELWDEEAIWWDTLAEGPWKDGDYFQVAIVRAQVARKKAATIRAADTGGRGEGA